MSRARGAIAGFACLLAAATSLSPTGPAAAESAPAPLFTDATGDANLVNDQGQPGFPVPASGPDTRPGSIGSADLVRGWFETTYVTELDRDNTGRVRAVRHVPTGVRLHLRMTEPPVPSFGPTVTTKVSGSIGPCSVDFRLRARGPLSGDEDPTTGGDLLTSGPSCPTAGTAYAQGVAYEVLGATAVLEYPFSSVPLADGDTIEPIRASTAAIRHVNGTDRESPAIDVAATQAFVVGSDVPPDVDCVATPLDAGCSGTAPGPDTGEDLHAAYLGSGPPTRIVPGSQVDLAEEFVVSSFRPDGAWLTFGFDVAGAGLEGDYVEINLASRLVRNGEVQEEFVPISDSFAIWKLLYGPADDPYRTLSSIYQDTPYGLTVALPAKDLDRLTILLGADVRRPADVAIAVAVRGTNEPVIVEPFPDAFGEWMGSWTQGLRKVRVQADHWGHGVSLAARLAEAGGLLGSSDVRRGVEVQDDRARVGGVATAGAMTTSGSLVADGPALGGASLFYQAQADQDLAVEWRTPTAIRRGQRSSTMSAGATLFATETDAGPGTYGFTLEVDSGPERSSSLAVLLDLWSLDPSTMFPGLGPSFFSDPAPADSAVLTRGDSLVGPAPRFVLSLGAERGARIRHA